MRIIASRLAVITGTATLVFSALFMAAAPSASASAMHSKPLPCHATMSASHPADFTTTTVRVKTVAEARVTTVAHYRTVNRTHHGRANRHGRAAIPYRISGATPGFRVVVDVTVRWPHRSGNCKTSFTPHS